MNTPGNERELVTSNNYVTDAQIARMGWNPITQPELFNYRLIGALD